MKEKFDIDNIPDELFEFAQPDEKLHDRKFETKPVGYFRDAWRRFRKNKGSIAGAVIILLIVIYAVFVPFISKYDIDYSDGTYKKVRPKVQWLSFIGFFDGGMEQKLNDKYYAYYMAMAVGAEDSDGAGVSYSEAEDSRYNPIMKTGDEYKASGKTYRDARLDSYNSVGFKYMTVTAEEYDRIVQWQQDSGITVIYPMVDTASEYCVEKGNANFWYKSVGGNPVRVNSDTKDDYAKLTLEDIITDGFEDNYLRDSDGNVLYYKESDKSMRTVRVLYYNYYQYKNGFEPQFYLGADGQGFDIFVRLAYGLRLSLVLALCVSAVNLTFGAIWGAVEGYYGGIVDIVGERISDILNGIPFIVLASLIQLHLVNTGKVSQFAALLFCYFLTGWIGTAYRVRTQFYRFKNQEYVLAARTLGAGDRRLMFKHIFPNALGTIITSSVLVIPSVILTESVLSYLGIINFQGKTMTSLGTLLSNGQSYLSTDPHIILFPALMISLLMISFNLFGNGLRDAFNPSLRGADE